jgi:hypothetical protein
LVATAGGDPDKLGRCVLCTPWPTFALQIHIDGERWPATCACRLHEIDVPWFTVNVVSVAMFVESVSTQKSDAGVDVAVSLHVFSSFTVVEPNAMDHHKHSS